MSDVRERGRKPFKHHLVNDTSYVLDSHRQWRSPDSKHGDSHVPTLLHGDITLRLFLSVCWGINISSTVWFKRLDTQTRTRLHTSSNCVQLPQTTDGLILVMIFLNTSDYTNVELARRSFKLRCPLTCRMPTGCNDNLGNTLCPHAANLTPQAGSSKLRELFLSAVQAGSDDAFMGIYSLK